MRILMACSEAVPFAKTGGLADVVTGLSKAFAHRGHDVTLVVPYYRQLMPEDLPRKPTGRFVEVPLRGRAVRAGVLQSRLEETNVRVVLIDHPHYFDRPSLYVDVEKRDYSDNCERFCVFSRCVLEAARLMRLRPDIVHAHDWQTGLIPALAQVEYRGRSGFERMAAIFTIHNMAFQGWFARDQMATTGLDWSYFNWRQMEQHDQLNLLKTGIVFADAVTTVSPTYAREIQTVEYGYGLEGVLQHRQGVVTGILNGVDVESWDPASDAALSMRYTVDTVAQGKAACKRALQERLQLPAKPRTPLCGMVSRLTSQKGCDLLEDVVDRLLQDDVQLVFLGTGEPQYERLVQELSVRRPDKVRSVIGFDEVLARQIEAGSDIFLMPSHFEPCGLNQMYSQRYGTVPVVHAVGGLADSVVDCTPETLANGTATGFLFREYRAAALLSRLRTALDTYRQSDVWSGLVRAGMQRDWSWERSAAAYEQVYAAARASLGATVPGPTGRTEGVV
jgi:starch synthase